METMKDESKAIMLMAESRLRSETEEYRSLQSLNGFSNRDPDLISWQDDVLAGGTRMPLKNQTDALLLVVPVVGAVLIWVGDEQVYEVESGQYLLLPVLQDEEVLMENPYPGAMVNILHGRIRSELRVSVPVIRTFSLEITPGQLLNISAPWLPLYVGKFMGRDEALLIMPEKTSSIFLFVIEGAFEVQFRLLETRDGMILWNTRQLELEALSNEAIVLIIGLGCS
jgi:quercetin 2,3-dioxygenase